jgi:hypothetical protein
LIKKGEEFDSSPFLFMQIYYLSAALADATKDANAAESFIARFARIFLSRSIPASFKPLMNLE